MPRAKFIPSSTPLESKLFLNTAEVAQLLGCTPHTATTLARTGAIKAAYIGRGYLVRRSDLDAFITECQHIASKRNAA